MKHLALLALAALSLAPVVAALAAGQNQQRNQQQNSAARSVPKPRQLMKVPLSGIRIAPQSPDIKNPYAGDKKAIARGKNLFHSLNCVGCHAPEGGGGMGPPLSDNQWKFGGKPADIYLTIMHGRPMGMPAWGGVLPPREIWYLVSYVKTLSHNSTAHK